MQEPHSFAYFRDAQMIYTAKRTGVGATKAGYRDLHRKIIFVRYFWAYRIHSLLCRQRPGYDTPCSS